MLLEKFSVQTMFVCIIFCLSFIFLVSSFWLLSRGVLGQRSAGPLTFTSGRKQSDMAFAVRFVRSGSTQWHTMGYQWLGYWISSRSILSYPVSAVLPASATRVRSVRPLGSDNRSLSPGCCRFSDEFGSKSLRFGIHSDGRGMVWYIPYLINQYHW